MVLSFLMKCKTVLFIMSVTGCISTSLDEHLNTVNIQINKPYVYRVEVNIFLQSSTVIYLILFLLSLKQYYLNHSPKALVAYPGAAVNYSSVKCPSAPHETTNITFLLTLLRNYRYYRLSKIFSIVASVNLMYCSAD